MDFLPADIAACYGTDWTANAIRLGTASVFGPARLRIGPSHVAIMCQHDGRMLWTESTTLCKHPCVIRDEHRNGCQAHEPANRIKDYVDMGGHVDLYRLAPIWSLSADESDLLSRIIVRYFVLADVGYDMGGALISGTRRLKYLRFMPDADLNELFCSELIAAVLMRIGRMKQANPVIYNPASLLRELVKCGTYQYVRSFNPLGVTCAV